MTEVLVDPDYPQIRLYRCEPDRSWTSDRLIGLDGILDLPLFDLRLPLASLYAGLTFRPRPKLVGSDDISPNFEI